MMMGVQVINPLQVKNWSALLTDLEAAESAKEQIILHPINFQRDKYEQGVILHNNS